MALTVDYRETIAARIKEDPAFARALLDEATTLLLNGEAESARLLLRDLTHGLVGFEGLVRATGTPSKVSVRRRHLAEFMRAVAARYRCHDPSWSADA